MTSTDHLAKWREENPEGAKPRNPMQRWKDQNTRKSAIDAFCWQCMGGSAESSEGAMKEIRNCPSGPHTPNPCPLWVWRPYK